MSTKLLTSKTPWIKQRNKKQIFFSISFRWTGFLMIPLTAFDDEYTERSKLTKNKKHS